MYCLPGLLFIGNLNVGKCVRRLVQVVDYAGMGAYVSLFCYSADSKDVHYNKAGLRKNKSKNRSKILNKRKSKPVEIFLKFSEIIQKAMIFKLFLNNHRQERI